MISEGKKTKITGNLITFLLALSMSSLLSCVPYSAEVLLSEEELVSAEDSVFDMPGEEQLEDIADITLSEDELVLEEVTEVEEAGAFEEGTAGLDSDPEGIIEFETEAETSVSGLYSSEFYEIEENHVEQAVASLSDIDPTTVITNCNVYKGYNIEGQNYWTYGVINNSTLVPLENGGIMLVRAGAVHGKLVADYYDRSYNYMDTVIVPLGLPKYGGFYAATDAYYVATGQENPNNDDSKEVFRIQKYSKTWELLGEAPIFAGNTATDEMENSKVSSPFCAAGTHFAMYDRFLFLRTAILRYDGHQICFTIVVDTASMTTLLSQVLGWTSHSFNSFPLISDGQFYSLDQGDAYDRGLMFHKNIFDSVTGKMNTSDAYKAMLYPYPGNIGDNYTGHSLGSFVQSSTHFLCTGNNDVNYGDPEHRNLYIASIDKNTMDCVFTWYSSPADSKSKTVSTPYLVPIGDDRFILLWSSDAKVHYFETDGAGNQNSPVYSFSGNLSDCVPVVSDGKLKWVTWDDAILLFYEVSISNISSHNAILLENGHRMVYTQPVHGKYYGTCSVCGLTETYCTQIQAKDVVFGNTTLMCTGEPVLPKFSIRINGETLKKGRDYEVTYTDGIDPGKSKITIKGTGGYKGKVSEYYVIKLQKASFSSITPGKKKLKIKWNKTPGATGYQIHYCTKSNFKSGVKKVTIKNGNSISTTIKNLKKNKTYYIRIRAFRKSNGSTFFSSWSKTKKAKSK